MTDQISALGSFRFLWVEYNLSFVIILILNFTAFWHLIVISVLLEFIMSVFNAVELLQALTPK